MTAKELKCLGIALKALMNAGMYDAVTEVINTMAEADGPDTKKEETKAAD
jgi:hypothetical protein